MKIRTILDKKGYDIYSISADGTLKDMVKDMLSLTIGSLLVFNDDGSLAGIITERDFLRSLAKHPTDWESVRIGDVMNTDVFTASITDTLEDVMANMTEHRVRHMPIMDAGKVVGMLSLGDIINAALDEKDFQNKLLKRYIKSWPADEEGQHPVS
jgi:CBS domain-containing protein